MGHHHLLGVGAPDASAAEWWCCWVRRKGREGWTHLLGVGAPGDGDRPRAGGAERERARLRDERDGVAAETTRDDVLAALSNARASVSTHERARLEHIYAAFRGDSVVNKGKGVVRTTHA